MPLPVLKRAQVLLEDDQIRRLRREAKRRKLSVGALVREAVDRAYPSGPRDRAAIAARMLSGPKLPVDEWEVIERGMEEEIARHVLSDSAR
ncbi:MAG: antitoxin [Candidatus Limnocylindria bacterium]